MEYILGQYNHTIGTDEDEYLTDIGNYVAELYEHEKDSESSLNINPFTDNCIRYTGGTLKAGQHYYMHSRIKRDTSEQKFNIQLIDYSKETSLETQYLKTITIKGGSIDEWVDVELVFTPLIDSFDSVLFELVRIPTDYVRNTSRYPVLVVYEWSTINNLIESKIGYGAKLIKLGVQGTPGSVMCINGEKIQVGRNGTFEFKNDLVSIYFFSVIAPYVVKVDESYQESEDFTSPLTGGDGSEQLNYSYILSSLEKQFANSYNGKIELLRVVPDIEAFKAVINPLKDLHEEMQIEGVVTQRLADNYTLDCIYTQEGIK